MTKEVFIQIGITALRSPTGDILPAVPLYIKADQLKQSGLTRAEKNALTDVSGIFSEKIKEKRDKEGKNVNV